MKHKKRIISIAGGAILAVLGSAAAFAVTPRIDLLGDPATPSAAQRVIVITADTKHVNVRQDEIIKFVIGNKAFVWNFNGPAEVISSFPLKRVAPAGMLDNDVTAYIERNPRSSGR